MPGKIFLKYVTKFLHVTMFYFFILHIKIYMVSWRTGKGHDFRLGKMFKLKLS